MVDRARPMTVVVGAFVIGCAVLLVVGCAGTSSETSNKKEQGRSPQATASEEARCQGTSTTKNPVPGEGAWQPFTTNDLPGCPKGGLLLGTDNPDHLGGQEGDDEIRGLGGKDEILGGTGNDVIYAGPGDDPTLVGDEGPAAGDDVIYGGPGDEMEIVGGNGDDVIYGGDGNDFILEMMDRGPDKLYCGEGKDEYDADKGDLVSSSCEKKITWGREIP